MRQRLPAARQYRAGRESGAVLPASRRFRYLSAWRRLLRVTVRRDDEQADYATDADEPCQRAQRRLVDDVEHAVKPKKSQWGTGTILLVEDEDMVRAVAERALTRAGYSVVAARQGEAGLER